MYMHLEKERKNKLGYIFVGEEYCSSHEVRVHKTLKNMGLDPMLIASNNKDIYENPSS